MKRTDKRQYTNKREERTPAKGFEAFEDSLRLEGRNAVMEALNHDKPIDKIFVKKGEVDGTLRVIVAKAREKGIVVQEIDKVKMEYMSTSNNCQGVIAVCPAYEYCEVRDIIDSARSKGEEPFVIILDEITDPHNLGAVIRTADACGAHGVIIPKRRAVGVNAVVSKTSAGAAEYVPVAKVTNVARAIEELQAENIWVACADMDGEPYFKAPLNGAIALVIGNEGKGVSRLVKEKCDFTVGIPMYGEISSLNASVSAGLIMYEVVRRRHFG